MGAAGGPSASSEAEEPETGFLTAPLPLGPKDPSKDRGRRESGPAVLKTMPKQPGPHPLSQ